MFSSFTTKGLVNLKSRWIQRIKISRTFQIANVLDYMQKEISSLPLYLYGWPYLP